MIDTAAVKVATDAGATKDAVANDVAPASAPDSAAPVVPSVTVPSGPNTWRTPVPLAATVIAPPSPLPGVAAPAGGGIRPASSGPGVKTCPQAPIVSHGRGSLPTPVISLIYWGVSGPGPGPYDAYWQALAYGSSAFFNRLREYPPSTGPLHPGVLAGLYNTSYYYPAGPTGQYLTEEALKGGILATLLAANYTPGRSDVIVVILPAGTASMFDYQYNEPSHHSSFVPYPGAGAATIAWAVVGVGALASSPLLVETAMSHEVTEAIVNPDNTTNCTGKINNNGQPTCSGTYGTGYFGGVQTEIGDLCQASTRAPYNASGNIALINQVPVQKFWSSSACRCVNQEDLNNVDINSTGQFTYAAYVPQTKLNWVSVGWPNVWWGDGQASFPFAGDWRGAGQTDLGHFESASLNQMVAFNLNPSNDVYSTNVIPQSAHGDILVPGDYDLNQVGGVGTFGGDGRTDFAVWQPSLGWRWTSSLTGATYSTGSWGLPGDIPTAADYDNDGTTDFSVIRPSNGFWYIQYASGVWETPLHWSFGPGDIPVPGDYNGDGYADFAYFHPATGTWNVYFYGTSIAYSFPFGKAGDIPMGRDIDGDWLTDLTVYTPSTGMFRTLLSSTWNGSGWTEQDVAGPVNAIPYGLSATTLQ